MRFALGAVCVIENYLHNVSRETLSNKRQYIKYTICNNYCCKSVEYVSRETYIVNCWY